MPDRELPEHLKDRLAASLTAGAPLRAQQPSQARYAQPAAGAPSSHSRNRVVTLAAACAAALILVGLAVPRQPRDWIVQTVGHITRGVAPIAPTTTSPSPAAGAPSGEPSPSEGTGEGEKSPSPEPSESPEATASPEPDETPEPSPPKGTGEPPASPSTEPSEGGHDRPEQSPTPVPGQASPGD